jgi:DNA-directed RNA polymerase subunit N (RpoN/RPB10)
MWTKFWQRVKGQQNWEDYFEELGLNQQRVKTFWDPE